METKILDLGAINGQVSVQIIRKKIKNVHLKVFRSLEVVLSVPSTVPNDWIDSFLNDHIEWIDSQITKYKRASGYNNLSNIRSGSSTQLLGKDVRIYKEASLSNRVELDENKCEGLIPIRDLDDDYYEIDEKNYALVGRRTHRTYRLGDPVRIVIANANLEKKQLDFALVHTLKR